MSDELGEVERVTGRQAEVLRLIVAERARQDCKWGTDFTGRTDERWLAILMEEVGEVAQAFLQAPGGLEPSGAGDRHIEEELAQVAAVVVSWLEYRTSRAMQMPYETQRAKVTP